jgi:NADPH2:quinone reductase
MRALLCKSYGPPESLVVEDVPAPEPGPGQLRVRVEAAGVNFPDALIIENKYQFKPELPFSPGGEVAGTVEAVGPGIEGWAVGDRVVASTTYGGFAEQCLTEADKTVKLPPEFDPKVAAAIVIAYGTTWHALFDRGEMTPKDRVLVLGAAGGVGLAAVEIAHAAGATVIAAASAPEKLEVCRQHGADHLIDYSTEDLRARLKEVCPDGPTVVYDPVGGELTEKAFRSIAPRGRHLIIGFASGEIPRIPLNLPLLKFASLVGVFWGDYARREPENNLRDLSTLMDWIREGRIKPVISATYPLAEGGAAIRHIAERRAIGKLIIEPQR